MAFPRSQDFQTEPGVVPHPLTSQTRSLLLWVCCPSLGCAQVGGSLCVSRARNQGPHGGCGLAACRARAGQVWAVFFGSTIFQSTLYLGALILGSNPSSLMSVALQRVTSTVSLAPADCRICHPWIAGCLLDTFQNRPCYDPTYPLKYMCRDSTHTLLHMCISSHHLSGVLDTSHHPRHSLQPLPSQDQHAGGNRYCDFCHISFIYL